MIVDDEQKDAARGIDPRYDPQFQRGYRPQPGERARTRLRPAPAPAPSLPERAHDDEDRAPAEAAALSIAPVAMPRAVSAPAQPPAAEAALEREAVRAAPAPGILDRLELSPRRNPLMLALWLIAGGFVVLGIVLYSVSVSLSYTGSTPSTDVGSLVISQLGWMLAGPLITVGLLTLVGLLFLTALAGRGRRRPPDQEADGELPDDEP
ncbi:hypothetical protein [Leifsonia shinshuensis]|uniref:Uncharacterized protein n=1 Tax=Leifsonia shinshuensis TaxID=150026 RepID=A0A853CNM0_9MICO|nr:hypothetical protein [Leifsonia shinshuensis]NYJ21788.1 hypothetical protein [Leifsonia shinshuensis]